MEGPGYHPAHRQERVTDLKTVRRFLNKIIQRSPESGGCWWWMGCRTKKGYGRFSYKGETRWAHRIAYAMFIGEIPELLTVDHMCHNPQCCRPDHLQLVTYEVNLTLKVRKEPEPCESSTSEMPTVPIPS